MYLLGKKKNSTPIDLDGGFSHSISFLEYPRYSKTFLMFLRFSDGLERFIWLIRLISLLIYEYEKQ